VEEDSRWGGGDLGMGAWAGKRHRLHSAGGRGGVPTHPPPPLGFVAERGSHTPSSMRHHRHLTSYPSDRPNFFSFR
jgi:hypothetical protein